MGYRLVGMPMDPPMMAGMFLIIVGLGLRLIGDLQAALSQ
jgi:hypothetical protein